MYHPLEDNPIIVFSIFSHGRNTRLNSAFPVDAREIEYWNDRCVVSLSSKDIVSAAMSNKRQHQ